MDPNDLEELARVFVDHRAKNPRSKITDKPKLAAWFVRQWSKGDKLEDLDEARAIASGTSASRARLDTRQRDTDRRRALASIHAWNCACQRDQQDTCPELQGAIERQVSECGEADGTPKDPKIASLEVRHWHSLEGWAKLVGGELEARVYDLRIKHPATFHSILESTEAEVKHGFSYYLEAWGEVGMQNSVIVARLREVFERKIEIAYQRS